MALLRDTDRVHPGEGCGTKRRKREGDEGEEEEEEVAAVVEEREVD